MNRRRFLVGLGGAAGMGIGGIGYARFIEPNLVQFTQQPMPRAIGSVTPTPSIAHISDLHLKHIAEHHQEIATEVTRRGSEIIVLTGDSIDDNQHVPLLRDFLALLPYSIPKFAILGNWEHWGRVDIKQLGALYERANCTLLINRSITYETRTGAIQISGVDDLVGGRPDLPALTRASGGDDLHVLLAHCPAHRDQVASDARIDLILSGHTHGGQVQIFGRAPLLPAGSATYVEGWYRDAGPPMYVSRGVGTSVLPVRFGARPEVSFFV